MTVMNRSLNRKQLQLGLNTVFGLEYKRYPEEWRDIFEVNKSRKSYEEEVIVSGLDAASIKAEGQGVRYSSGGEVYTARYLNLTIALAFALTEEAVEDGLYGDLGARYSKALARSMQQTKEVLGANVLNYGFDSAYPIGDGQPLFSASHPTDGGATSNTLATPAQLGEASLEATSILADGMTDHKGLPIAARLTRLVLPKEQKFVAERLLNSMQRVGTADNDINALKSLGIVDDYCVNHRLTNPNNWFLKTDVPDGFKHFVRVGMQRGMEGDFETGNLRYKARERYSFGVSDWRGGVGVQGG